MNATHEKAVAPKARLQQIVYSDVFYRLSLALVFCLGLGLRLATAFHWNSFQPDSTARLVGDEPSYDNMARELLQGFGVTWPGRVPLYPIWLAGIYCLTDGSYIPVAYVQCVPGLLVIGLTVWLSKRLFGRQASLLAGLLAAISYVLIHQSLHLMTEVLYTPAILLVTIALLLAAHQPTVSRFVWVGVLVGFSNLIRPSMLMFPVFLLPLLGLLLGWWRGLRLGAVTAIVSLLVVTPWVIHNAFKYNAVFALQTSNAILWQGSPEYYHLIHDEGYTYMQIWNEVLYGPGWQERNPNSVAGDRYWTVRALRSISKEPLVYLRFAAEKLFTYWLGDPNADWGNTTIFSYKALRQIGFLPADAVQIMIARALPIVALGALILLRRRWRQLWPLLVVLAYFTLLHAATHAEARLSEPLQPLLLVLIAGGVAVLVRPRSKLEA